MLVFLWKLEYTVGREITACDLFPIIHISLPIILELLLHLLLFPHQHHADVLLLAGILHTHVLLVVLDHTLHSMTRHQPVSIFLVHFGLFVAFPVLAYLDPEVGYRPDGSKEQDNEYAGKPDIFLGGILICKLLLPCYDILLHLEVRLLLVKH